MRLERWAPAKINLCLHVVGRDRKGYHRLQSLVVFCDVADRLALEPGEGARLSITGAFAQALTGDGDNLVLRAAELWSAAAGQRDVGRFYLEKRLPVASGIGGGSSDAAAALKLCQGAYPERVTDVELAGLALRLGADVPVCLEHGPRWMEGVGERLSPAKVPPGWLLLVNPLVPLPTADVFRAFATAPEYDAELVSTPVWSWDEMEALSGNRLEAAAQSVCPAIAEVLTVLGAFEESRLVRMSGSGATCFAVFSEPAAMRRAEAVLRAGYPGWWVAGGRIMTG